MAGLKIGRGEGEGGEESEVDECGEGDPTNCVEGGQMVKEERASAFFGAEE